VHLAATVTNAIANVTVDFVSGENGAGAGSLAATDVNDLAWTPPGGTQGAAVTIANGETKVLEGGGATGSFVRVTRTSTDDLAGEATVTLAKLFNNALGFDNISSAEAAAGDTEYRCICAKNESAADVTVLKAWIGTLGTQLVSGAAQLGASGAGTIGVAAGTFADWPASGFCRIEEAAGTLREIVYYSSRTAIVLTVPATGRALLGTTAAAGLATDKIYPVPGIRIGKEAPASQPDGAFTDKTVAGEGSEPAGVAWSSGITAATGLDIGTLAAGYIYGLWLERTAPEYHVAIAAATHDIRWGFDSA